MRRAWCRSKPLPCQWGTQFRQRHPRDPLGLETVDRPSDVRGLVCPIDVVLRIRDARCGLHDNEMPQRPGPPAGLFFTFSVHGCLGG